MMIRKPIYILWLIVAVMMALTGCVDDPLIDDTTEIGDGVASLSMQVSYFPDVATDVSSRSAGNSIETIERLTVVVFNEDSTLFRVVKGSELKDLNLNLKHSDRPVMSVEDATNAGSWTEGEQAMATFRIDGIPYGRYRFYCVANMDVTDDMLTPDDTFTSAERKLRGHRVDWTLDPVTANGQMFGYFTPADRRSADAPLGQLEAPTITVNRSDVSVHSWLKRLASKVTVAFDGSGLHDNVSVFIHKVTIKDIPRQCALGENNSPASTLDNRDDVLHLDGETIYYGTGGETGSDPGSGDERHTSWMEVTRGTGVLGSDHSATSNALFFYENMQGDYEKEDAAVRERYNKEPKAGWVHEYLDRPEQDKDKRPWHYDTKDKIDCGTYIEVEGYYESRNEKNTTHGPIIYRFMLGKNTTFNYNAQRNHHYKVTLRFRGWANQPEWHIEYVEKKPDGFGPTTFYMPYIYNQRVDMPIRIIGDAVGMDVTITENDWGPYDYDHRTQPESGQPAQFAWNKDVWDRYNGLTKDYKHLGFLALSLERNPVADVIDTMTFAGRDEALDELYTDYTTAQRGRRAQNVRHFDEDDLKPGWHDPDELSTDQSDHYEVYTESDSRTLMLPLFTRAKSMIVASGYSGNNPYEYFYRRAKIHVKISFRDNSTVEFDTEILQVPRLTNPKAIWRDTGKKTDFDVTLMTRTSSANKADYVAMKSDGSWTVEIETGDKTNFTLEPMGQAAVDEDGMIRGPSKSFITFKVKFGGKASCAVVLVKYNGEKCVHRIFLRQGYEPMQVSSGGATWLSYNLKHGGSGAVSNDGGVSEGGELVSSPLSFGSYFKRNAVNTGILESNNDKAGYGHLDPINDDSHPLDLSNGSSALWKNISGRWLSDSGSKGHSPGTTADTRSWQNIKIGTKEYTLPTYAQFNHLWHHSDFGFGVMYGDGATTTQTDYEKATGFDESNTAYGMRGVVVYNLADAHQIFFPISKSGFGRRHQAFNNSKTATTNGKKRGQLLYGDVAGQIVHNFDDPENNNEFRPIPYNLGYSPGAIYWIKKIEPKGHNEAGSRSACAAWDMNYFSLDFGPYTANCMWRYRSITSEDTGSDALPVRLVLK